MKKHLKMNRVLLSVNVVSPTNCLIRLQIESPTLATCSYVVYAIALVCSHFRGKRKRILKTNRSGFIFIFNQKARNARGN